MTKVIQSDRYGYFNYETYLPAEQYVGFTIQNDNGNPVHGSINLGETGTNSNPELKMKEQILLKDW